MSASATAAEIPNVESWSGKDRGDENFPVGVIIRPDLRRHVHAYYSFARNADDIGDSPILPPDEKIARLDHMEAVLLGQRPDEIQRLGQHGRHVHGLQREFHPAGLDARDVEHLVDEP